MRRFTPTLAAVALCVASLLPGQAHPGAPPRVAEIDRIARAQADSGFSGVVLVARGDSVLLRHAYGRVRSAEAKFAIASITKSFTALTVLTLKDRRQLSLTDSLGRFFPHAPPDKRGISLHQLLTHTAGFGTTDVTSAIIDRDSAVRALLAQPLTYPPGRGYTYNNSDYQLLAAVVEVITGRPWKAAVSDVLLKAGAHDALFQRANDWSHRGSNGMQGTADDLLLWTRMLDARPEFGRPGGSARAVPHVVVRREGPYDVAYGYGMRLYLNGDHIVEVFHSGSGDDGHSAVVRRLDSGETIIVLSDAGFHGTATWSAYVAGVLSLR
ncbi:MAG TPA: serine hydrolase domain-containing protein [Gemmatimonadaceae bacterium]